MSSGAEIGTAGRVGGTDGLDPFTRKLSGFVPLTPTDLRILNALTTVEEAVPTHRDLATEGTTPRPVFVLKEGMAVRYRNLPDGRRQIMTFLIPGDLCNPHMFLLKTMDHSIGTLTPVRVAPIPRDRIMEVFVRQPRISAALWWSSLQEEAMLRERIVSFGRRDARGRVAYLLCELLWRYKAIGLATGEAFALPLTQMEIADTLGLTAVHVNRVLQSFRSDFLIRLEQRKLSILDVDGLQELGSFDGSYLHLNGASAETTVYFDELERTEARNRT